MEVRRTATTTQTSVLLLYHLNVSIECFFPRIGSLPSGRRYDLRIRYVPVNFLEKFQDDRSSLLYFYQQVMRFFPRRPMSVILSLVCLVLLKHVSVPLNSPLWSMFLNSGHVGQRLF